MLKFLTRGGKAVEPDDVVTEESADAFWRSLPKDDPIAVQRAVCDALLSIKGPRGPEVDRLRALLMLERRSHSLLEALLADYATADGPAPEHDTRLRHPIVELSRAFAQAHEYFFRYVRDHSSDAEWMDLAPSLLVHLYRHREVELLLALYRYETLSRGRWKDINGAYEFALASDFARRPVMLDHRDDNTNASITLEHAFIRILLLQLTGGGQFLPFDIASARQWIGCWSELLSLVPGNADDVMDATSIGFRVDLSGSHGLKRASSLHAIETRQLRLDTSPLAPAIERALASTRSAEAENASEAMVRARRLALLATLKVLFAAERPRIKRRGDRIKVESMSVQAIIGGLPSIGRTLRNESRRPVEAGAARAPYIDEITITDVPQYANASRTAARDVAAGFLPVVGVDVLQPQWQLQDRSESGCLIRGQTLDTQQSLPGSLMALRDDGAPWTIAVVRRLSKVGGALVELGVEHIGRNPQRVVMLSGVASDGKRDKFLALYLPESDAYPQIPIKTLIVPAHEYAPARVLTMVSTASETAIRLKTPIEHQRDFVWTAFELVGRERR
jgi:hypothetical protein